MNELAVRQENAPGYQCGYEGIDSSWCVGDTLRAYRRALNNLAVWLNKELNDAVLAEYITELHQSRKSPGTIAQVVAAVKWQAKNPESK